jgi:acetyl-CoA C-acetyltransferase
VWVPKTGFAGITSRTDRTKPIIAAVNGVALGGGLEIAMAADIIVAVDHARFGLPEVKVGLFAGAGGVQRLTRQIGRKKAVEMIVTGEPITPQEALDTGLINYVVPADQLMKQAEAIALKITEASPMAVSSSLQLLNESSRFASEDDAVTFSHTVFDNLLNSDDFYEGSTAFAQKRKPRWIGK